MLTDEQMAEIWAEHGPQDPALQAAYRMGLERAVEVCEDKRYCQVWLPSVQVQRELVDAIRAEVE